MTTAINRYIALGRDIMSYVRVSILGTFGNEEVWSINPVFDPSFEFPGSVNQANLDAACALIANRSLPATLSTALSASAARTGARVEVRDDTTDALIAISTQASTAASVGLGSLKLPPQAAAVLSIRTNTTGGSGRGRIYWPAMGATLAVDGRISLPNLATFTSDFKLYLTGIQNDLAASFVGISFNLAVRSKTTKTTPHAVRLQAGNVVDTQRRRRDGLPEAYTTVNYP